MDYGAKPWRIKVYRGETDPLDISRAIVEGPSIKGNALDLKGYHAVETELKIQPHESLLESLDDQVNGLRWAKGNKITVEVANSAGVYVLHRTLRLLKPKYDDGLRPTGQKNVTPSLTLQVGDLLKLKESRYPPQDLSRLFVSTDVALLEVANHWLQYFGLPTITTLPGDPVPTERMNFTIQYPGNSFPAEHIGRLLYAVGGYTLWVDSQERLRLVRHDLTPEASLWYFQARDLFLWGRSQQASEEVAGTVRVLGTTRFVFPYQDPADQTATTITSNLTTTETVDVTTFPLRREIKKTAITQVSGFRSEFETGPGVPGQLANFGNSEELTIKEYGGGTPDAPNPNPVFPATPGIPPYLQRETTTVKEQLPTSSSGGGGSSQSGSLGSIQTVRETVVDYYHKTKYTPSITGAVAAGVEIYKIVTTTKIYDASGSTVNSNVLVVDSIKTQFWTEAANGLYLYTETLLLPREEDGKRQSSVSMSAGKSSPPTVEYAPSLLVEQSIQLFGIANFNYPIDAPDNDHPRDLDFGQYLPSYARAQAIAQSEGAIIIGRHNAYDLGFIPGDNWLTDPKPLQNIFVQVSPTQDKVFLVDLPVLLLGDRACYLAGSGVYGGLWEDFQITPPYALKVRVMATTEGREILTTDNQVIQLV